MSDIDGNNGANGTEHTDGVTDAVSRRRSLAGVKRAGTTNGYGVADEEVSRRRLLAGAGVAGVLGGISGLFPSLRPDTALANECEGAVQLAPTINTAEIFQATDGKDPREIPNQSLPISAELGTRGIYSDSGSGNIYHFSSYIENTGSRAAVAVAGHAKGQHVFGANFGTFAYNDVDNTAAAVSCEIGGGILSPAGGNATLLLLKASGGNVGGGPNNSGAFILMAGLANSEIPYGIRVDTERPLFSTAFIGANDMTVPVGIDFTRSKFPSGSPLRLTSTEGMFGIEFNGAKYTHAAMRFSATAPYGINFSGSNYANAAIRFSEGNNIQCGSDIGTKIGTGTGQKIGFWNATPVSRPTALTTADSTEITAADGSTVDSTYGPEEAAVIQNLAVRQGEFETIVKNLRTRVNEAELKLKSIGLIG